MRFGLSYVSSLCLHGATTIAKVKLFSTWARSTGKFLLYVSVEIKPFKHWYFSTQTNLVYLGLVYVTMITGTRSESTVVRGITGV